ncbi:hypothetical protein AB0A66_19895 [Streptomyces longwoodensis]|uniref:hypothetical protein n=1 Tax=Streptomyces longwoodensis TaxID=68231 RepID=UPI00340CBFE7
MVAILTQAQQMSETPLDEIGTEQWAAQADIIGDFVVEAMSPAAMALTGEDSARDVTAVARSFQHRLGALVACFSAAYVRLAHLHDNGENTVSSGDVLRELALNFQPNDRA